jgi:hypothetical protein
MKWQDPGVEVTNLIDKANGWYGFSYGQCVSYCERIHNLATGTAKRDFWIRLWHVDKVLQRDISTYYRETIHGKGQRHLPEDLP